MENFLAKLKPDNKINIGVSVSPTVGLEMIVVDPVQHKVMKYAQRSLGYNFSSREIEDYVEFKNTLSDLFNELKIDPKTANVVLNLPNVAFGHAFLPTVLDDEGVTGALVSKVEENYLFKKNVPVVSWAEVKENNTTEKRYVLYAALQEGVVEAVKQIFADLGATLVAIENTYSSLIKTLEYTGLTKDFATSPGSWNILLVSQNSYAVFSLLNYSVIEYYEDPLAIKSFSNDEVYVAVSQAASAVLEKFPSDKLLIISESNDVSAEILAIQMKHPGDVMFLECNQYAKTPVMDVDLTILPHYVKAITPEAIATGVYRAREFGLKLNFLKQTDVKAPDTIDVFGFALTYEQMLIYSAIIGVAIIAICFLCSNALGSYTKNLDAKKSDLEQEAAAKQTELAELKKDNSKIDIYTAAKTINKNMLNKVLYYNAIGADIPTHVWLTNFYADSDGAYGIAGGTTSVDEVYLFFRNIKSQVPTSDLILAKLGVIDNDGTFDIENATDVRYTFELSNDKYAPVAKQKEKETQDAKEGKGNNPSGSSSSLPEVPVLPETP